MENHEKELQYALQECKRLKEENLYLKRLLKRHSIDWNQNLLTESKEGRLKARIRIFKDLFKGREDVFAVRWQDKNGKTGYSPLRLNGENISLTNSIIYEHLMGYKTIGIYPLLRDNTCWFLAVDFDKNNWQDDGRSFLNICKEFHVPASMERSRSGNGCHIWIFFETAIPASLARNLGKFLLTKTIESKNHKGIASYDRFFPSQDKLQQGGLGNLIALPLQKTPRKSGNSVFVDENFTPYVDQWLYLSNIRKMKHQEVEQIVKKQNITVVQEKQSAYVAIPRKVQVFLKNGIYIQMGKLPSSFIDEIRQLATFHNPAFFKAQAKRLSTFQIPRLIDCTDKKGDYLILPRGCMEALKKLCEEKKIELIVDAKENVGTEIDVNFIGDLTIQQEEAVQSLLNYENGILSATTGFGKTVVAACLIARRKVNTLVIVHRKQLMEQWKESLTTFLTLEPNDIGFIGGGKNTANQMIDIATIQSLNRRGEIHEAVNNYGQVIVDECHHISAYSFEKVLKHVRSAYVHGLTATPTRKDGLHPIMTMQCGPVRYKVNAKDQARIQPFKNVLIPRKTRFNSKMNSDLQKLYDELLHDYQRNNMIFNDVLLELEKGSVPLILTERIEHVEILENLFNGYVKNMTVLTGELKKKERQDRLKKLKRLSDEEEKLIIATGKYIGEGFDYAVLDTLFLTMPIAWKGTLQQYVGRLHRNHKSKEEVKVYDYVDARVEMLQNMFEKRMKGYKAMGYKLEDDNSKITGEQMKLF